MYEEPHNLHCLPNSIWVVRSTRTIRAGHTASSGKILEIFTQKRERKKPLKKQRRRWEVLSKRAVNGYDWSGLLSGEPLKSMHRSRNWLLIQVLRRETGCTQTSSTIRNKRNTWFTYKSYGIYIKKFWWEPKTSFLYTLQFMWWSHWKL